MDSSLKPPFELMVSMRRVDVATLINLIFVSSMYSIRYIWSLMEEFVGAIICIISPRATSTDDEGEGEGDEGADGFSDFGEFSDILFIVICLCIPYIYNRNFY
jgi:hypothetical protein